MATAHTSEMFEPAAWTRMEFEETPIYVRDCAPGWFVPNAAGDRLLESVQSGASPNGDVTAARFLARLPAGGRSAYPGRAALLRDIMPRELWFHLTNRCNMACRHCLFTSSPSEGDELETAEVVRRIAEAHELGVRVFAFTGGEPFIHPGFEAVVGEALKDPDAHVVTLTNGATLRQHAARLGAWGAERFHLQISLDGLPPRHDAIRGKGAFDRLHRQLGVLREMQFPFTLSMCVDADNVADMPAVVELAAELGASNLHFMWLFVRGRAGTDRFAAPERIFDSLRRADEAARRAGLNVDNIDALKTQVFAPSGTIHDGSAAGWESAAIGPDGQLYPSAALIGIEELGTPIASSLAEAWQKSPVLAEIRRASAQELDSPLRFLTGGGDIDHSYTRGRKYIGDDPYIALYEQIALWLIAREAGRNVDDGRPRLRLKMGDVLESCGAHGPLALVHSNCLLSTAQHDSRTPVREFYNDAATSTKEDILNPACYSDEVMTHIPPDLRFRGYGCGSPVLDADPKPGATVVDLGSGRGIECFIASRLVGEEGRVIGVDMLDPMLDIARSGAKPVADNLGFDNMDFRKGYLEALPLEDDSVDLVLSNCVLNLSTHKRHTFAEIVRALKPGGRMVVSDVVCENEPDAGIRNDDTLKGECIAGALTQRDLVGLLDESGLTGFRILKRFPYRDVRGHRFFSMTFEAAKPHVSPPVRVICRGPMAALQTPGGQMLFAGIPASIPEAEARQLGDQVAILDEGGTAVNMASWVNTCACAMPVESSRSEAGVTEPTTSHARDGRRMTDCMVCGAPLVYRRSDQDQACAFCGKIARANAVCEEGHFVCDTCHSAGALAVIEHLCRTTDETDMIALMQAVRSHPSVPMHGPEHHGLVPGVILATYRNLGGTVTPAMLETGIRRGGAVMGGACAFVGSCGAVSGVGVAFSILLDANPLTPDQRQRVMLANIEVAREVASIRGARCCQRDVWIALTKAAELSRDFLPIPLRANTPIVCEQYASNQHCLLSECPLWRGDKPEPVIQREGGRDADG
jgi:MoaA/NifB/PqqE/SkfB family radical SAM enzyme/SAM-dependent methyltransferase